MCASLFPYPLWVESGHVDVESGTIHTIILSVYCVSITVLYGSSSTSSKKAFYRHMFITYEHHRLIPAQCAKADTHGS